MTMLHSTRCVYDLALEAIHTNKKITALVNDRLSPEQLDYAAVYEGRSSWQLLPSFDHPENPLCCLVSGTGLTHKSSALTRQMMHQAEGGKLTDSMQMYQWGLEGGFPETGKAGVQPEWFYKGTGVVLRAHGQPLEVPPYGLDGGEEPEAAGVYVVDRQGHPWRVGFTTGNEFSDHVMERKNYLYLAPSKLRTCAIGPELVLDAAFDDIKGNVRILRGGAAVWEKPVHTGVQHMAHSLANLEHHHFKYPAHRIPLQAHVHFFGADAFSFGEQVALQPSDVMQILWNGWGRPLQNTLVIAEGEESLTEVKPLL